MIGRERLLKYIVRPNETRTIVLYIVNLSMYETNDDLQVFEDGLGLSIARIHIYYY